jgi:predicted amidohydrolase
MKTVAAIQMASGPNVDANLIEAGRLIASATKQGAKLVVLPENFALMGNSDSDLLKIKEEDGEGIIQDFLSKTAAKHSVWLVGGTVPIGCSDSELVRSACLVYNDKGECVARYDKIHLFDVELLESNENYTESKTIQPGSETVVVETPFGKLGLAICYDVRFPELFRQLLDKGAEIIAIPAAFTAITGKAHWESLIRARAIENLCYVIAAAQGGYHISGRETHGDSMIVDPWGTILDHLPSGSGTVVAKIDDERLSSIRKHFPAINHRRM